MPDDDRDNLRSPRIAVGNPRRATARLRARLESEPVRAALYFALGAVTASIVALIWSAGDMTLPEREPAMRPAIASLADPVTGALAEISADSYVFHWRDRDGVLFRAAVDADPFRQYAAEQNQRIDEARVRQRQDTVGRLRVDLRPVLDGVQARVADYGDWMYNWWTAWILLGQAIGWTWEGLLEGQIRTLPDAVQTRLTAEIRERYNAVVLRSEVVEPQIQALIDRAVAGVQREVVRACGRNDDALRTFIEHQARQIERKDAGKAWTTVEKADIAFADVASTCRFFNPDDQSSLVALLLVDRPMSHVDAGVNDVIVRLSRPFATKLISFMVLPVATTAVAGGVAIPFIGVPAGALAGVLAGGVVGAMVIGFSASAAVDWLLTRADEHFSRDDFEANLRNAVTAATVKFEAKMSTTVEQYVDRQYQQVLSTMLGRAT